MLSRGMSLFTDIPMTIVGMMLFLLVFAGVTFWTFMRFQSRDYYQMLAQMPFREEANHE